MTLESNNKDEFGKYKTLFIPWKPATTFFRILTRCCLSCLFRIQKMVRRRNRMPCVNGGRTVNHDNNFVCRCKDGYTGRLCEQRFFQRSSGFKFTGVAFLAIFTFAVLLITMRKPKSRRMCSSNPESCRRRCRQDYILPRILE